MSKEQAIGLLFLFHPARRPPA